MLKKNKNGNCPFGYVEFNGMCIRENQQSMFQFSNEFTSSNGYQPVPPPPPPSPPPPPTPTPPPPKPPTPTPPGPDPSPDDTEGFLRRAAEITGTIFGVGVAALEADQRYQDYLVNERLRMDRVAREVDDFYMFSDLEAGDGLGPPSFDPNDVQEFADELNLFRGTQEPMTDSMGRLLDDDSRFLINTDTEQGLDAGLEAMTDADYMEQLRELADAAEIGNPFNPQDGQGNDSIQARRNKDAEEAAREELEKRQKANEERGDPFEGAPEFDDDVVDGADEFPEDSNVDMDFDNMDLDLDLEDYPVDYELPDMKPNINIKKPDPATTLEKANKQLEDLLKPISDEKAIPPTEEEIAKMIKEQKKTYPFPKPDPDADTIARVIEKQKDLDLTGPSTKDMAGDIDAGISSLEELISDGDTGANPIPDIAGQFGGESAEAVERAEGIIAGAEAAGTVITEAERVSMITRVALAAEAGEDVAVGSAIMSGLLAEGVASIGAVAAVGVEFAALAALTYGAEKVYNAAEGIVERPDSLDGAAHEITQQEMAYFQSVATQQVRTAEGVYADNAIGAPRRRAPISPFAEKGSGSGERPTRQSDARNKALYNDMSDAEKKVFDDNYNKMVADEQSSIDYWNNIPEGTVIQNSADGYQLIPPHTVSDNTLQGKPGTPQSWIDDFNNQLENINIQKQQDGIGNQETMDQQEATAAQSQKTAEMQEVQDYLDMMTARDEAYLDSLEVQTPTTQSEVESQPEVEAQDMPNA